MHCCRKLLSILMLAWLCITPAHAEGISVNRAELRLGADGYHLSATYDINLNFELQQALSRGIPLYFVGEFTLTRSRWYWFDEEMYKGEQTVKFSYNVLTRQYRISRGALYQNFDSYEEALRLLDRLSSPAIPAGLLKPDSNFITGLIKKDDSYVAAVRLRLDTAQLPRLLQVNALTSKDWELNSGWYRWVIQPAEIPVHSESRME